MALNNKYDVKCFYCGEMVPAKKGFLQRDVKNKKWAAHCRPCYDKKKQAKLAAAEKV